MMQCPLLEKCKLGSGIDCTDRNFDGKQGNIKRPDKEPCEFYKNLEREKRQKPRVRVKRKVKK